MRLLRKALFLIAGQTTPSSWNLLQIVTLIVALARAGAMQLRSYEWLARSGYAAEGCVYVIMGGLAVLAALGAGGRTTGAKGALLALLSQPFGFALLGLVAFGLLCSSGWRIADVRAVDLAKSGQRRVPPPATAANNRRPR